MTKTSLEMKKLVEEFIKITNVKYEDQTEKVKEKSNLVDWQFHVGTNVIVSKNTNREDRIHVNVNMRFPPEDAKLLVSKNPSFSKIDTILVGPSSVYVFTKDLFIASRSMVGEKPFIKEIGHFESFEIEREDDFAMAELIINAGLDIERI